MGLSESPTNNELLCMCKSLTTQPARPQLENMDFLDDPISIWLVVDLLWKMMDESSVGMKLHSQLNGKSWNSMVPVTTNQLWFVIFLSRLCHCVLINSPCFSWLILLIFLINLADTSPDFYACCIPLLESQQLITSFHGQYSTKKNTKLLVMIILCHCQLLNKSTGDGYFMLFSILMVMVRTTIHRIRFLPIQWILLGHHPELAPALRDHGLVERSGARWE